MSIAYLEAIGNVIRENDVLKVPITSFRKTDSYFYSYFQTNLGNSGIEYEIKPNDGEEVVYVPLKTFLSSKARKHMCAVILPTRRTKEFSKIISREIAVIRRYIEAEYIKPK